VKREAEEEWARSAGDDRRSRSSTTILSFTQPASP
jgi:hypothetical protein